MKNKLVFYLLLLLIGVTSKSMGQQQCALTIQYDDAGNRIYRGTDCDPECSIYVDNTNDNGFGSLRKAIACAKDGDTIQFDPILIGDFIDLTSGTIPINVSIGINLPPIGNPLFDVSVRAQSPDRVFDISNNVGVHMRHLDIWATENFGGDPRILLNEGNLILENIDFYDDIAQKGSNSSLLNKGILTCTNQVNFYYVNYN